MTRDELDELKKFLKYKEIFPEWREGQALFNILYAKHRDIANIIRGSKIDPFYKNENIDKCLEFLEYIVSHL